jgi:hypothetical protein
LFPFWILCIRRCRAPLYSMFTSGRLKIRRKKNIYTFFFSFHNMKSFIHFFFFDRTGTIFAIFWTVARGFLESFRGRFPFLF